MERARRHQRFLARVALVLLALIAELAGRSLSHRLDFGKHVASPSYSGADYYPILLAVVKVSVALMLARLAWRFVKASRLLAAHGELGAGCRRRVRIELSPKLWLGTFLVTSLIYLLQIDAEGISSGRWPLLAPWLHTAALPVFAVLSVVVAVVYRAVEQWFSEYETYAYRAALRASRLAPPALLSPRTTLADVINPRALFGLAFESRPPPLHA
jgi:hypothetical protein